MASHGSNTSRPQGVILGELFGSKPKRPAFNRKDSENLANQLHGQIVELEKQLHSVTTSRQQTLQRRALKSVPLRTGQNVCHSRGQYWRKIVRHREERHRERDSGGVPEIQDGFPSSAHPW